MVELDEERDMGGGARGGTLANIIVSCCREGEREIKRVTGCRKERREGGH
jgi:hypothetical protein